MHDSDVVYIVREGDDNEELRYSLRSVAANLPHRNVVIAGYIPTWVKDVHAIPTNQATEVTKYGKAMINWRAAVNNDYVSQDFMLFNDDFYIMQPIEYLKHFNRGPLRNVMHEYESKGGPYLNGMKRTSKLLYDLGINDQHSYALHIPMWLNKTKYKFLIGGLEAAGYQLDGIQMRTLYGNFWKVGGEYHRDVKINSPDETPDPEAVFLSSLDESFSGKVGDLIRERFNTKCKYEV